MKDFFTMNLAQLELEHSHLAVERRQCRDEGLDIGPLEAEFDRLLNADLSQPGNQAAAQRLLDATITRPRRTDHPFIEPSDLNGIQAESDNPGDDPPFIPDPDDMQNRVSGAWLGRACGCLLGKPVEGWRRSRIRGYLMDTGRFPLSDYFTSRAPEAVRKSYGIENNRAFIDLVSAMPEDDDMNYSLTALCLLEKHGDDLQSEHVARFWLENIPVMKTFTAERIAMRNFLLNIPPPDSAAWRNPYREWIGAQIRADIYGVALPGQPRRAAALAFQDARISHTGNGIYGAIWVAAMNALAWTTRDPACVIRGALSHIPKRSRLRLTIEEVLNWHQESITWEEAEERIHAKWNEAEPHDWTHVISNAAIVAAALLWGGLDFGRTICLAVGAGFDTDCNGATAGCVAGLMLGAEGIPERWTAPLHGTLETILPGRGQVRFSELKEETIHVIKALRRREI